MPTVCLASCSDSRLRSRKPTLVAKTYEQTIPDTPTLIRPANQNRTYLTIRNMSQGVNIYYAYSAADITGVGGVNGFEVRFGESVDLESPEAIYAKSAVIGQTVAICMDEGSG